jgi:hypothetical protein
MKVEICWTDWRDANEPSYLVECEVSPGEPASRDCPGADPEVEILAVWEDSPRKVGEPRVKVFRKDIEEYLDANPDEIYDDAVCEADDKDAGLRSAADDLRSDEARGK